MKEVRAALADQKAALLWAWLVGPLVLLTLVEHKEPRHFAPCIVPVVLLLFRGISAIRLSPVRKILSWIIPLVCLTQYLLVTNHLMDAPYYLNRPSHAAEIQLAMKNADPHWKQGAGDDDSFKEYCWLRTKNIVLEGFDPNMALSLAWNLRPAVVFDLDLIKENQRWFNDIPHSRFEDLFYYSSSSIYNQRCLCKNYFETLNQDTILTNADFVLIFLGRADAKGTPIPGFHSAGIIGTEGSKIQLFAANVPSAQSYRAIYERELLRVHTDLPAQDVAAIYFDLAIDETLHQNVNELRRLLATPPLKRALGDNSSADMRNIYWMADDIQLKNIMLQYLRSVATGQSKTEKTSK